MSEYQKLREKVASSNLTDDVKDVLYTIIGILEMKAEKQ